MFGGSNCSLSRGGLLFVRIISPEAGGVKRGNHEALLHSDLCIVTHNIGNMMS